MWWTSDSGKKNRTLIESVHGILDYPGDVCISNGTMAINPYRASTIIFWTRYDMCQTICTRVSCRLFRCEYIIRSNSSPLMPHICVSELGQHWFRQWLVACSVPSHYLNKCWFIAKWTPGNKFQWNSNRNSTIFIQETSSEIVVWQNSGQFVQGEMS